MRVGFVAVSGLVALATPSIAEAATIVVYANPLTLERRTVVLDPDGPDRAYLCMLPPAVTGCQPVPIKRSRG